jgi:hypothetical protein
MWKKISWTDRVKNKQALRRNKEEKNVVPTIKGRKAYWIASYGVGTAF